MKFRSFRLLGPQSFLLLVLVLWIPLLGRAEESVKFVGLRKCNVCHGKSLMGDQVAAWRDGPHADAFETLKTEKSRTIAAQMTLGQPPHESRECLGCHATADSLPPDKMAYPVEIADGVQCESCHGPGSGYRKKKVMSDRDEAERRGLWSPEDDPAICVTCHNEQSPTFDPERYTLPDGTHSGFDFAQALDRITHTIPAHVKGNYIELEREEKARKRRERAADL